MSAPHTIQVIYIRGAPARVWRALTSRDESRKFFYETDVQLRLGGAFRLLDDAGKAIVSGEVLELDAPHLLRVSWRELSDPEHKPGAVEYRLEDVGGSTRLTVSNFDHPAPSAADLDVGRKGWGFTLSNLKSVLETGDALDPPKT